MSETENQTPLDDSQSLDQPTQDHLGSYIKRERERQKIELPDLARENRMPESYLQALEAGNYSELPGDTYTRAYLKSISTRLGLEEEKILNWYLKETKQAKVDDLDQVIKIENKQDYDTPSLQKGRLVILAIVCLALLISAQVFRILTENSSQSSQGNESAISRDSSARDSIYKPMTIDSSSGKSAGEPAKSSTPTGSTLTRHTPSESSSEGKSTHSLNKQAKTPKRKDSIHVNTSANDLIRIDSIRADSLKRNRDSLAQDPKALKQNKPQLESSQLVKTLIQISAKDSTWFSVVAPHSKDYSRVLRKGQSPKYLTRRDTITLEVGTPELIKLQLNSRLIKLERQKVKIYDGKILP